MKITATLLDGLLDFASSRGLHRMDLLQLLSNPEQDICSEGSLVEASDYLSILKAIDDDLEDEHWAVHFGLYLNLTALGAIYEISTHTNSIQQALLILENYLNTNFPFLQFQSYEKDEQLHIQLVSNIEDPRLSKLLLETTSCLMLRELSLMLNSTAWQAYLPYTEQLTDEQRQGISVSKETTYTFSIDNQLVHQKINPKSLHKIELLLPQFLQMLEKNKGTESFTAQTRNMILHLCAPELPSLHTVCRQFALSTRSFQRKLAQENNSFRSISNAIKKELAIYLRAGNKMKTQDIAYILGYSESSAYLNALKTWDII